MVVLSAAVCTKNGRTLLSRQFVEMNRIRIEGLLAAFPKLMGTGNKQHTFVETDSVRYVYQPIESLFLLLITNKASNIVEDLETLRLLSKVVAEIAGSLAEDKIQDKCFDLVFAFDEVITSGGHRESITLQQIRSNLEMDSHEEKLQNMIKKSKMDSAKEEGARQAKVIRERQKEQMKTSMSGMGGGGDGFGGGGDGFGGGGMGGGGGSFGEGGYGGDGGFGGSNPYDTGSSFSAPAKPAEPVVKAKGMKLGAGNKKQSLMDAMVSEDNLAPLPVRSAGGAGAAAAPPPVAATTHPVSITVEEKLSAHLTREGTLESMDIKGSLSVTANDDAAASCQVQLAANPAAPGFTFQARAHEPRAGARLLTGERGGR